MAEPVNGVGTRILSYAGEIQGPDFSSTAIRRYLSFFFQAFELVIYSCEEAARTALEALTELEKARLLDMLEHGLRDGIWDFSLLYFLIYIAAHSPLMGACSVLIREFVTEQFRLVEMCLLGMGIREDELRIAPAYRLGVNETDN